MKASRNTFAAPQALPSPTRLRARRSLRYSSAEKALKSSFESYSSEPSPLQLKINALNRSNAALVAQAQEAKERVADLHASLSDRSIDPERYRSLQRERWMQERRGKAKEDETRVIQDIIAGLSPSPPAAEDAHHCLAASQTVKQQANLLLFAERSPTKTSFASCKRTSRYVDFCDRRITISEMRSLRLRPSALVQALKNPISLRMRSMPLDVHAVRNLSFSIPDTRVNGRSGNASVNPHLQMPLTPAVPVAEKTSGQRTPMSPQAFGSATIYAPDIPRTVDQISATLADVVLPDYALNLLGELDDIETNVALATEGLPLALPDDGQDDASHYSCSSRHDSTERVPLGLSNGSWDEAFRPFSSTCDYSLKTIGRPSSPHSQTSHPDPSHSMSVPEPVTHHLVSTAVATRQPASSPIIDSQYVKTFYEETRTSIRTAEGSPRSNKHKRFSMHSLAGGSTSKLVSKVKNRLSALKGR